MKKTKLRIWCLLLAMAMLMTVLPVAAIAKDNDDVYDAIEEIIEEEMEDEISMKKANTKSKVEQWVNNTWMKALKKKLKNELEDELKEEKISVSSLWFDLEDFEAAVPQNKNDEDGENGSVSVCVYHKDTLLGIATIRIEADQWSNNVPDDDDDDDDDDKKYFYGADGLVVKILWKNDRQADRPDDVVVHLYRNGKLYKQRALSRNGDAELNWRGEWDGIDGGKKWTVDVEDVPAGYKCDIEKVSNDYFEITMTKIGTTAANNNNNSTIVPTDKVNPSTGAF